MSSLTYHIPSPMESLTITARHAGIVVCVDITPFELIPDEVIDEMYMEFPTLKSNEWIEVNGVYVFIFKSNDVTDASKIYIKVAEYLKRKAEEYFLDRY